MSQFQHTQWVKTLAQQHGFDFCGIAKAKEFDEMSEAQMHQHHRWAQATTVLQIAIALAAIALLTRKVWVEYAMFGAGTLGVGVGILAAMHI